MKLVQVACKTSESDPEDFISNMPDNVVTNIMDRMPLKDAVRTGILSKNWRFKWTLLSQLVFDENFFDCFKDAKDKTDVGRIISRILLHIRGAITKFVLSIDKAWYFESVEEEISHWIVFLSRVGIKHITLEMTSVEPLKLPAHLFSCMELKHMKLINCCFDPPASFHGFPNLLSLELDNLELDTKKFVKFFTQCPILENLIFNHGYGSLRQFRSNMSSDVKLSDVKLAEIAKLANLKKLSLLLAMVDKTSSSSILELVGSLPKLQELHLDFRYCMIREGVAEKRCSTTFPCLKTLDLEELDISNGTKLSYALQMIGSFPNLQTLIITSIKQVAAPTPEICSLDIENNTMGLLQLRRVALIFFTASEYEVCLIKYLLESSPVLGTITISLHYCLKPDEKSTFAKKMLKYQRAFPAVNINIY